MNVWMKSTRDAVRVTTFTLGLGPPLVLWLEEGMVRRAHPTLRPPSAINPAKLYQKKGTPQTRLPKRRSQAVRRVARGASKSVRPCRMILKV